MDRKRRVQTKDFRLDCVAQTSRMREYNGLQDYNLTAFFASKHTKKLLLKQGLKKGLKPKKGANVGLANPPAVRTRFPAIKVKRTVSHESRLKPLSKEKLSEFVSEARKQSEMRLRNSRSSGNLRRRTGS